MPWELLGNGFHVDSKRNLYHQYAYVSDTILPANQTVGLLKNLCEKIPRSILHYKDLFGKLYHHHTYPTRWGVDMAMICRYSHFYPPHHPALPSEPHMPSKFSTLSILPRLNQMGIDWAHVIHFYLALPHPSRVLWPQKSFLQIDNGALHPPR